MTEAILRLEKVEYQGPDLIEIRFDYMESPGDPGIIRDKTDLPLIVTNRRWDQGGQSRMNEPDRTTLILDAVEAGFNYADLELNTPDLKDLGSRVKTLGGILVISHHDFKDTPSLEELRETMRYMAKSGADVSKIIGTAQRPRDNLTYLSLFRQPRECGLTCFGMGRDGILSRILSPLAGGEFTYASSHAGEESAPGQLTLAEMREIYTIMGV
ncbi:3-dehydroquinate dehydratase [Candidatus Bathyarchaeota archaeon]|jgi:3-dehydroquinate dehydratase type I|nr:3-dehydroquinate dehydratase [Candidatus Bathyarchaeota archaeon]|tara:strand:+ start:7485 stop:8123 length:639 start_codon:yes stop_codon:yes gene_type:complete